MSSCSQDGPKAPSCWTYLQSCCNGNMLRRLSRWRLFFGLFSASFNLYFFFFKPPPPTHTVRELIYSLSASSPDLHSGMCLERNTETKLRPPTCSVKWNNTKFTIKGGNKGFEVVQSTLLLVSYLKKLSGYC